MQSLPRREEHQQHQEDAQESGALGWGTAEQGQVLTSLSGCSFTSPIPSPIQQECLGFFLSPFPFCLGDKSIWIWSLTMFYYLVEEILDLSLDPLDARLKLVRT